MHSNVNFSEQDVNQLAYQIWEMEGRPIGQAERHWQMALEQATTQHGYKTTGTHTQGDSFLGHQISPSEHTEAIDPQHVLGPISRPYDVNDAHMSPDSRKISGSVSSDYIEAQNKKSEKRSLGKHKKKEHHEKAMHAASDSPLRDGDHKTGSDKKSQGKHKHRSDHRSDSKQSRKKSDDNHLAI